MRVDKSTCIRILLVACGFAAGWIFSQGSVNTDHPTLVLLPNLRDSTHQSTRVVRPLEVALQPEEKNTSLPSVEEENRTSGHSDRVMWARPLEVPAHVSRDFPFRVYGNHSFLVAIGVLSMDAFDGRARRDVMRSTWMQYSAVDSVSRSTHGAVLAKFLVGRHESNSFKYTPSLVKEIREHHGDVIALDINEKASRLKSNASNYGEWGLECDVKNLGLKSLLWRKLAIAKFRVSYIAKMDDDVFVVVPHYVAALNALPRQDMYWGMVSQCRFNPYDDSTRFPYVYGMLQTTSLDVAESIASAEHLQFALRPYTGRPSDYLFRNLDREDIMIGGGIYKSHKRNVHVFHDCRFIEPSYVNMTLWRENPKNYTPFIRPNAIMFHKLPLEDFEVTMRQFPEDRPFHVAEFVLRQYDAPKYRWYQLHATECRSTFLDNCYKRFTPWAELGPVESRSRSHWVQDNIPHQDFSQLPPSTPQPTIVLGVLCRRTEGCSRRNRDAWRDAWWNHPLSWSATTPHHPVALRFVLSEASSGLSAQRRAQLMTPGALSDSVRAEYDAMRGSSVRLEAHAHGDILSLQLPKGKSKGKLMAFMWGWLMLAAKLYPSVPFIATLTQPMTESGVDVTGRMISAAMRLAAPTAAVMLPDVPADGLVLAADFSPTFRKGKHPPERLPLVSAGLFIVSTSLGQRIDNSTPTFSKREVMLGNVPAATTVPYAYVALFPLLREKRLLYGHHILYHQCDFAEAALTRLNTTLAYVGGNFTEVEVTISGFPSTSRFVTANRADCLP